MTDADAAAHGAATGTPIFVRKGHGRPQDGLFDAHQYPTQPGALQGLQCVDTTEPQKTSYCRRPEFSEQYAHAREAGIHKGIHEFDGRNTPHPKISARVHHGVGYQAGYH